MYAFLVNHGVKLASVLVILVCLWFILNPLLFPPDDVQGKRIQVLAQAIQRTLEKPLGPETLSGYSYRPENQVDHEAVLVRNLERPGELEPGNISQLNWKFHPQPCLPKHTPIILAMDEQATLAPAQGFTAAVEVGKVNLNYALPDTTTNRMHIRYVEIFRGEAPDKMQRLGMEELSPAEKIAPAVAKPLFDDTVLPKKTYHYKARLLFRILAPDAANTIREIREGKEVTITIKPPKDAETMPDPKQKSVLLYASPFSETLAVTTLETQEFVFLGIVGDPDRDPIARFATRIWNKEDGKWWDGTMLVRPNEEVQGRVLVGTNFHPFKLDTPTIVQELRTATSLKLATRTRSEVIEGKMVRRQVTEWVATENVRVVLLTERNKTIYLPAARPGDFGPPKPQILEFKDGTTVAVGGAKLEDLKKFPRPGEETPPPAP